MTVRAKAGASHITHQPGPPKTTSIGQGKRSRPRRKGRKPFRGQGKG
jgi:hypothetical protein